MTAVKRNLIAAVAVALVLAASQGGSAAAAPAACAATPAAVAHRGGTERAVENTLNAFAAAGDAGVDIWELDVRFDSRGTPVVLHDSTVDRVSPRSGPIDELDTGGGGIPTDDGQRIPTLREVYDLAAKYRAEVLTELKVEPTAEQWTTVAAQIDATIGRGAVTLMSFDRTVVAEAADRIPGTQRALIHALGYLSPEQVKQYGDVFNKQYTAISQSRAEEWHTAGVRLLAWTVDQEADWERLAAWPIDGFVTNRPIEYERWAAGRCATRVTD